MKLSRDFRRRQSGSIRKKRWKHISKLTRRAWLTRRHVRSACPTCNGASRAGTPALHQQACLAHHQHFPYGIARQEKLDRSEIAEEVFNVPVVEHALQARNRSEEHTSELQSP